jgi:hypothetical protein
MHTDFTPQTKNATMKRVQAVEDTRLQQITELLARREDIINSTEKVYIEIHLKGDSISISTQVFDNN